MIKALIFDWGDTIMRDIPGKKGPMCEWDHVEWVPCAETALKVLSRKYYCAIATGAGESDAEKMKFALRRIDAEKYFRFFISSKELGIEKPRPEFFLSIASALNFLPSECVHIGNLYEKDIQGAKAAGMMTVFYNEKKDQGNFPDADKIIYNMQDLPSAVAELSQKPV